MLQKQLVHRPDFHRLITEGYEVEIKGSYALVHHIPYVNEKVEIEYGTLVSEINPSGSIGSHVVDFIGEQPCDKEGKVLTCLLHPTPPHDRNLGNGIVVNRSFSNKPSSGYANYYEKFVQYIKVISAPAISLDKRVTAQTFRVCSETHSTVFQYEDSNSARASIGAISEKLKNQKIGIIGLGGNGSYVLDLVAKCPVRHIHLYDGDIFYQHNAFRAPGAASVQDLEKCSSKVEYYSEIYSKMHKGIVPHNTFIQEDNVMQLQELDFVFLCVDQGNTKKIVVQYLMAQGIPFVDSGIGVTNVDDTLVGQVRTTFASSQQNQGLFSIDMTEEEDEDDAYQSNIQIVELNALSACMAVMRWKKYYGFYQDVRQYCVDVYSINDGELSHEKIEEL